MRSLSPASAAPLGAPPAALVEAARMLEVVPPHERRSILRDEGARSVDRLLVRVARSRGAIDVALCEGLAALAEGDRLLRLGWSSAGDYARERLGVAPRTAQAMVRLGRALSGRPLLRAALRSGLVSLRAAQTVLPVAVGEAEGLWVERARGLTVRALELEVRAQLRAAAASEAAPGGAAADDVAPGGTAPNDAASGGAASSDAPGGVGQAPPGSGAASATAPDDPPDPDAEPGEEPWQRVAFPVTPEARAALDEALEVAGRLLGPASPRWQRIEAIAQEYLGGHPADDGDEEVIRSTLSAWGGFAPEGMAPRGGPPVPDMPEPSWRAALEATIEEEMKGWYWLETVEPVAAPPLASLDAATGNGRREASFAERERAPAEGASEAEVALRPARCDPIQLDEDLGHLAALRERWEDLLGHLALLARLLGLWREMGFASFGHYVKQRLGLGLRSVEQRIALERKLYDVPQLREALREGRVSAEQARLVTRVADEETAPEWIARAESRTCIELRREVEAVRAAQTRADEEVALRLPVRVAALLAASFRAAERAEGRHLVPSECLERVARHFVATWGKLPKRRSTPKRRALERDGWLCQVPGCSRAAAHAHHVRFRAHGGGDEEANLTSVCAAHHLHGVHLGYVRVRGQAPAGLEWELGANGLGEGLVAAR